ncbi:MAG: hypothetical protein ABSH41_31280 [Syntrophobacteraceae bacterium]|jgi:hypothetical protein
MSENYDNEYGVHRIDTVNELTIPQIMLCLSTMELMELEMSCCLDAFRYLEYLINGRHICLIQNARFSGEESPNLFILVHCADDLENGGGEIDISNYALYPLEDELWSAIRKNQRPWDIDLGLLEAILKAGVEPLRSSETRLIRACEAVKNESEKNSNL